MKKIIVGGLFFITSMFSVFAGDAAVLVDNGFSADGNYYVFGQYGKTDKSFQGWADIYTVDVEKNDYVDDGVFHIKPSVVTFDKTGKDVFDSLAGKSYLSIKKYNCNPAKPDQILYIREDESKMGTDEIIFKDFVSSLSEDQAYYHVKLNPVYVGSGIKTKSSFSIQLEKQDSNGNILAKQIVGTPTIKRSGVIDYKIERIVCDNTGKNIVFIIEKSIEDKTGINIRYMIETAVLDKAFFENLVHETSDSNFEIEVLDSNYNAK